MQKTLFNIPWHYQAAVKVGLATRKKVLLQKKHDYHITAQNIQQNHFMNCGNSKRQSYLAGGPFQSRGPKKSKSSDNSEKYSHKGPSNLKSNAFRISIRRTESPKAVCITVSGHFKRQKPEREPMEEAQTWALDRVDRSSVTSVSAL